MLQRYSLNPEHPESEAIDADQNGKWMLYKDYVIQMAGKEEHIKELHKDVEFYKRFQQGSFEAKSELQVLKTEIAHLKGVIQAWRDENEALRKTDWLAVQSVSAEISIALANMDNIGLKGQADKIRKAFSTIWLANGD